MNDTNVRMQQIEESSKRASQQLDHAVNVERMARHRAAEVDGRSQGHQGQMQSEQFLGARAAALPPGPSSAAPPAKPSEGKPLGV